jgi:hypothetical protein
MKNKLERIIMDVQRKKLPPEVLNIVTDFLEYLTWQNVREIRKLRERIKKMQSNNLNV